MTIKTVANAYVTHGIRHEFASAEAILSKYTDLVFAAFAAMSTRPCILNS
jgi:hypothetical protein